MSRFLLATLLFVIFALANVASASLSEEKLMVRVGIYENAPKIYLDESGSPAGFWPDLVRELALRENWEVRWVPGSWQELTERLRSGEIDMLPDVGHSHERARRFEFNDEIVLVSWSRVYARPGLDIQTVLDLDGLRIAVLSNSFNYVGAEGIRELLAEFDVDVSYVELESYRDVFSAVEEGRADAGIANKDFGNLNLSRFNIQRTPILFSPATLYFGFPQQSAKTSELIPAIDQHMRDMKQNAGSPYYAMLEQHFGYQPQTTEILPNWFMPALAGGAATLLLLLAANFVLGWRVRHGRTAMSELAREKASVEAEVHFLAHHDPLTRLPNRRQLDLALKLYIDEAIANESMFTLAFIDLDRFKTFNDTLGHTAGDSILKTVGERLKSALRTDDFIARVGGDEFVAILKSAGGRKACKTVLMKLTNEIDEPVQLEDREIRISASIGTATYPDDGDRADLLLRNADIAMYDAKAKGRNQSRHYSSELTDVAAARFDLENAIREGISRQEFFLVYQPQVNLETERLEGVEALLRWDRPGTGLVSPAEFIPVAESSGLIVELDQWVLEEACRQSRIWRGKRIDFKRISVNVSMLELRSTGFASRILDTIARLGAKPESIGIEVTESMLMRNIDQTCDQLQRLHDAGVFISIDDFGTGYSSLNYLRRLRVDELKIDKSFIDKVPADDNDSAICNTIIQMGSLLGLNVIAEGVETREQADYLRGNGCLQAQGFLFAKPQTAKDIEDFLK